MSKMIKIYSTKIIAINVSMATANEQVFGVTQEVMGRASASMQRETPHTYRILSLDGGGVRGLIEHQQSVTACREKVYIT